MPEPVNDFTDRERRLMIRAVADLSNACDLPNLTPHCPFYEQMESGPTCAEECRDLIERYHDDLVPPAETLLGVGLGAVRRLRARRGSEEPRKPFDAREELLSDLSNPIREWRLSSLLLEFRDQLLDPTQGNHRIDDILDVIESRGLELENLYRFGFVTDWAVGVYMRIFVAKRRGDSKDSEWTTLLENFSPAIEGSRSTEISEPEDIEESDYRLLTTVVDWALTKEPRWVLAGGTPTVEELRHHENNPQASDPPAKDRTNTTWLIERFTQTYLAEWSYASLLQEWKYMHSQTRACAPPMIMKERCIDARVLATEIADRAANREPSASQDDILKVSNFATVALNYLRDGNPTEASSIYRALVELRPNDYEALNNLGFCLIPSDAAEAEKALVRCVELRGDKATMLTRLNLVVAYYILGQMAEAVSQLELARTAPDPDHSGYVWLITEDRTLPPAIHHVGSLNQYALRLADVLSGSGGC